MQTCRNLLCEIFLEIASSSLPVFFFLGDDGFFRAPHLGCQKGVTPNCSDFPVSFRYVPICLPCFGHQDDRCLYRTSLLIFVVFARFIVLTAKFWQVYDHQRQELTMNQSKTTLFRSRNLKGLVFLSPNCSREYPNLFRFVFK